MGAVLTVLAAWTALSLGLAAAWIAAAWALPRFLHVPDVPPVVLPQPRAEHVDLRDEVPAPSAPAAWAGAGTGATRAHLTAGA